MTTKLTQAELAKIDMLLDTLAAQWHTEESGREPTDSELSFARWCMRAMATRNGANFVITTRADLIQAATDLASADNPEYLRGMVELITDATGGTHDFDDPVLTDLITRAIAEPEKRTYEVQFTDCKSYQITVEAEDDDQAMHEALTHYGLEHLVDISKENVQIYEVKS